MTARPGQRDVLIERFRDVFQIGLPGLEWCCISTVLDDPEAICLTQIWTDKAAHDTATRSDVVVSATGRVTALLAGPPEGSYGHVALRWER
jgi:hypothetical protein